jgi:outer membrane murein-binding lipoprotein Lpp
MNPECAGCRALATQVAALTARIEQLEARLNQNAERSVPGCRRFARS